MKDIGRWQLEELSDYCECWSSHLPWPISRSWNVVVTSIKGWGMSMKWKQYKESSVELVEVEDLTQKVIKSNQRHYGGAIRDHTGDVDVMRKTIWAIYRTTRENITPIVVQAAQLLALTRSWSKQTIIHYKSRCWKRASQFSRNRGRKREWLVHQSTDFAPKYQINFRCRFI